MKCKKSVETVREKVEPTNAIPAVGKCPDRGTKTHELTNNADGIKMIGEMAATGGTA
jgi:hypothetical protein